MIICRLHSVSFRSRFRHSAEPRCQLRADLHRIDLNRFRGLPEHLPFTSEARPGPDRSYQLLVRAYDSAMGRDFQLEGHLPPVPGLPTHVTLFDSRPTTASQPLGHGEGADETETLLNLRTNLTDTNASKDPIVCVASAYQRRTGKQPEREGSVSE